MPPNKGRYFCPRLQLRRAGGALFWRVAVSQNSGASFHYRTEVYRGPKAAAIRFAQFLKLHVGSSRGLFLEALQGDQFEGEVPQFRILTGPAPENPGVLVGRVVKAVLVVEK